MLRLLGKDGGGRVDLEQVENVNVGQRTLRGAAARSKAEVLIVPWAVGTMVGWNRRWSWRQREGECQDRVSFILHWLVESPDKQGRAGETSSQFLVLPPLIGRLAKSLHSRKLQLAEFCDVHNNSTTYEG